jgi:hypothetical protein
MRRRRVAIPGGARGSRAPFGGSPNGREWILRRNMDSNIAPPRAAHLRIISSFVVCGEPPQTAREPRALPGKFALRAGWIGPRCCLKIL